MRETRTAAVGLEDELLIVRIRAGLRQTLDDARENIDACVELSGGGRPGLLLDITHAVSLDPPVRHFYTGTLVVDVCSALALVVEMSPLGRIMGNVYLRVANPDIPTRVFDNGTKARAWLRARSSKRNGRPA